MAGKAELGSLRFLGLQSAAPAEPGFNAEHVGFLEPPRWDGTFCEGDKHELTL